MRNAIPFGLVLATVFMCALGFAGSLWLFTVFLMLGGVGIAIFHPRGGALAAEASGSRRALGMAIFSAGGTIGYAAASLVAPLLDTAGRRLGLAPLQGLIFALPFGLAATWAIARNNPQGAVLEQPTFSLRRHLLPHLRPLAPLFTVMVLRSATVTAFSTFIQVLQGRHGQSALFQGLVLFMFVGGATFGGMAGSYLSDHYGRRCVTVISLLLCPPLLYGALSAPPLLVLVLLLLGGFTLRAAEPVNIAQTQDLLPHGMGTASAIAMGFTWGVAGLLAPVVGLVSRHTGSLTIPLGATVALPVIAALVALLLPTRPPQHAAMAPASPR